MFSINLLTKQSILSLYRSDSDEPNNKKKRLSEGNTNSNIENYCNNQQNNQQVIDKSNKDDSSNSKTIERKSSCIDSDLEKLLDPEYITNSSNLDPEITHSAEQLEQILEENLSRKRKLNDAAICGMNVNLTEEENEVIVKEALSQFYFPATQTILSAIEDLTQSDKRQKLDLNIDLNQNSYIQVI